MRDAEQNGAARSEYIFRLCMQRFDISFSDGDKPEFGSNDTDMRKQTKILRLIDEAFELKPGWRSGRTQKIHEKMLLNLWLAGSI